MTAGSFTLTGDCVCILRPLQTQEHSTSQRLAVNRLQPPGVDPEGVGGGGGGTVGISVYATKIQSCRFFMKVRVVYRARGSLYRGLYYNGVIATHLERPPPRTVGNWI